MGRYQNILNSSQYDREFLEYLYLVINKLRNIAKTTIGSDYLKTILRNKRAMLYFSQPSTRTFLSFQNACQILGMSCSEVRDISTSSEVKGESKLDSIRTFSSYVDLIIMRTPDSDFPQICADFLSKTRRPIPIVNAGAGSAEHPTQSLLDIYTLQRSFKNTGGLDGKTILFCGDLKRGRTVKSLVKILMDHYDVNVIFSAPENFQLSPDWKRENLSGKFYTQETENINNVLHFADALYMTRIQDEHDTVKGESKRSYDGFKLNSKNINLMKPNSVIMHPLPRRDEIESCIDDDPRAVYWRQCRNGMWARVALIAYLFGKDKQILEY